MSLKLDAKVFECLVRNSDSKKLDTWSNLLQRSLINSSFTDRIDTGFWQGISIQSGRE
jgi:hypothetical protein